MMCNGINENGKCLLTWRGIFFS